MQKLEHFFQPQALIRHVYNFSLRHRGTHVLVIDIHGMRHSRVYIPILLTLYSEFLFFYSRWILLNPSLADKSWELDVHSVLNDRHDFLQDFHQPWLSTVEDRYIPPDSSFSKHPSKMREIDALVSEYQHEKHRPRESEALLILRKVASLVKPIMRRRDWRVGTLCEFYPHERNLLGLNVNAGQKICLRLRYAGDERQFLPIEQVVDTMLHE